MIIRGQRCKRVDLGHSMRLAAVDISAVPAAQVRQHTSCVLRNAETHAWRLCSYVPLTLILLLYVGAHKDGVRAYQCTQLNLALVCWSP